MRAHRETDWFIPALVLTIGAGVAAYALMIVSGFNGRPPFIGIVPRWLMWLFFCLVVALGWVVAKLHHAREERPIARLIALGKIHWKTITFAALGSALAGINLVTYMWLKPQIDYVAPFWMDETLANFDAAILGSDGWRLLTGLNTQFVATTYTPIWFATLLPAMLYVFFSPPSRNRTASILSYFLLWSIFGPIGQYLMSAAGPIFYSRLGLGPRFDEFQPTELVTFISGYLWDAYTDKALVPGAGISAMPSLHIATVAWMTLSFASLRSRLTLPAALFAIYMWVASVALGWHYMVDGLVGGAMAVAAFYLARLAAAPEGVERPLSPART